MDKASVVRLITLIASLLAYFGVNVPQNWQDLAVGIIMFLIMAWGFWKNNYLGSKGRKQKDVLQKNNLD